MAYIGVQPRLGNFQACDAITTSSTATFNLLVGGVAVFPQSAQHCLVSLNGVLQAPISSYTISGSTIVFASALTSADSIDFITILGDTLDLGVPSDDTVKTVSLQANAVTGAKLNTDVISAQTALTSAPADTDELLISDAGVLKRIDVSLVGGKNTPAFSVGKSGDQSIDNSETMTKVTWDTEHLDSDNTFASDKFTPAVAGEYFISFNFRVQNNGDNEVNIIVAKIYKNGSVLHNTDSRVDFRSNKGRGAGITCTVLVNLDTDDYIEFYGGNNAAGGTSTIQYRGTLAQGFRIIT